MKKIVLIGFGAIGEYVAEHLPEGIELAAVVELPENIPALVARFTGKPIEVVSCINDLSMTPDLVLEAAGQAALKMHGEAVLRFGWPLTIVSVGALADEAFHNNLKQAAQEGNSRYWLLPGALGGIDALSAAKRTGLEHVSYQSLKSIEGWRGTHAENLIDLDSVTEATCFFKGTAREAATLFPKNANVAATIALAGAGFEATDVELWCDPNPIKNRHTIDVKGVFGDFTITMKGNPLAKNPKTSMLAALSVLHACDNLVAVEWV